MPRNIEALLEIHYLLRLLYKHVFQVPYIYEVAVNQDLCGEASCSTENLIRMTNDVSQIYAPLKYSVPLTSTDVSVLKPQSVPPQMNTKSPSEVSA